MSKKRIACDDIDSLGNEDEESLSDESASEKHHIDTTRNEEIAKGQDDVQTYAHFEDTTFLDSFYGLDSTSPADRARSAHAMLTHCLLGPNANTTDAGYAFRRLLNGLCSGRAAARQGYASTLTSFLKVSISVGAMKKLQQAIDGNIEQSVLAFVRNQLLKATEHRETTAKKRGSEGRDHHFGRLFGILSVIRSGILIPENDQENLADLTDIVLHFLHDLILLYKYRKWLREPSTFAIIKLLEVYFHLFSRPEASNIAKCLSEIVVKEMLSICQITEYTAEQIAIALNLQFQMLSNNIDLPPELVSVVLSKESVHFLAKALSETSVVSPPRMHVVWDVIWYQYLSVAKCSKSKQTKNAVIERILVDKLPGSSDSAQDIVAAIIDYVVKDCLLGTDPEIKTRAGKNITQERRALSLAIVKVLCGIETISQTNGPFRLLVDGSVMEKEVLTPFVIQHVFIDTFGAGGPRNSDNFLKLTALNLLESLSLAIPAGDIERRFSYVKAFLTCDPKFDRRTKTKTCEALLFLEKEVEDINPSVLQLWKDYHDFLQNKVLFLDVESETGDQNFEQVLGYLNLLVVSAKKFGVYVSAVRCCDPVMELFQSTIIFLFVGAFFDVSTLKGKKQNIFLVTAKKIQKSLTQMRSNRVLVMMQDHLFSLLGVCSLWYPSSANTPKGETLKFKMQFHLFKILDELNKGWKTLEAHGVKPFAYNSWISPNETVLKEVAAVVLRGNAAITVENVSSMSLVDGFLISNASLMSTLHLMFLLNETSDSGDEFGAMDLDDKDDTINRDDNGCLIKLIDSLSSAQETLLSFLGLNKKSNDTTIEKPFMVLTQTCLEIFSLNLKRMNNQRGISSLLRSLVRAVWSSALSLFTQNLSAESPIDLRVIDMLLSAIGFHYDTSEAIESQSRDAGIEESDDDEHDVSTCQEFTVSSLDKSSQGENTDDGTQLDEDGWSRLETILLRNENDDEETEFHHVNRLRIHQNHFKSQCHLHSLIFFDVLLSNSIQTSNNILTSPCLSTILLKLLTYRRNLENSILSSSDSECNHLKAALLEKITLFIEKKCLRMKTFPIFKLSEILNVLEGVVAETRKSITKDQRRCCSEALAVVGKFAKSSGELDSVSTIYASLIEEWATNRTTVLKAWVFSPLMLQQTSITQRLLFNPLVLAARNAHSPGLKIQAFRMLSFILVQKLSEFANRLSESKMNGSDAFIESPNALLQSITEALHDSELRKVANLLVVVKTAETLLPFLEARSMTINESSLESWQALHAGVSKLEIEDGNQELSSLCQGVTSRLEPWIEKALSEYSVSSNPLIVEPKKKKKKKGKKK